MHRSDPDFNNDFDDEVDTHISMLTERLVRRGMPFEDARCEALRQFGNRTVLKEIRNDMRTFVWLETLWQDLRYGVRVLRKNKGFAAVAAITLALGIGADTAIFSVVNAAILRPLPYPHPQRLAILWGNVKRARVERRGASYPDYLDWRDQTQSFETMAAFTDNKFALTGIDTPERISGEYVSQPYFSLLGIHPALGRTFSPAEDRVPQRDAVVVLSDGIWKHRFGGEPAIVGRTIQLDGHPYTVIGIAPPGFSGLTDQAELWAPFVMSGSAEDLAERGTRGFEVLARLRGGVSFARAQADIDALSLRLARAYPGTNEARGVEISPLEREILGDMRQPLLILLAAVGFVLLIACTNVANLLLARSEARQREIAMRIALGASRRRVLRQLLAESAVLVTLGCLAGLILAHFGARALMAASPVTFPSYVHPSLDPAVTLFTVLICCSVGLVLGLAPATHVRTAGVHDALKQSSGRSAGSHGGRRFRNALVVVEISFSMLLLIGAGLLIRSLERLATLNPGYDPSHLLALRVSLPGLLPASAQPDAGLVVTADEILRRVSQLPSVQSASIATDVPLGGESAVFYTAEGQPAMNAQTIPRAYFHRVSPDFFKTLRTSFLVGRAFTEDEVHHNADAVIVTESLVKRFWSGSDPIGKRIKVGGLSSPRPWLTIVGVVHDLKYRGLPDNPTADPDLFLVFNERSRDFSVLVRTSLDPSAIAPAVRTTLRQAEPSILIYDSASMEELIGHETARPRFTGWLMAIFAGIALTLAVIGIYGVVSYSVSRRAREIGVRIALGADRPQVLRMIVGSGMGLVVVGPLLGTGAALALTRLIGTLLYGVTPSDPLTYSVAALTLAVAALMACLMPALRAARIDPAVTLRNE
jgi:putative ABC transport system permease protein